jgi:hypothetical protein
MRSSARFRQLVERFQDECRRQQVQLSRDASEDFLLDRITSIAETLGIQPHTALHTHANDLELAALVAAFKQAEEERQREFADASPAVLDLAGAGRLVAALGQVVRCVSLNHDSLGRGETEKWEAIGVLDDTGDALTLLGLALRAAHTGGGTQVLLSDEAVVHSRRAVTQTISNLADGTWSFGRDQADRDAAIAARMADDLALLPPQ